MDKITAIKNTKKNMKSMSNRKRRANNVWLNMIKAFLLGGTILAPSGQIIYHACEVKICLRMTAAPGLHSCSFCSVSFSQESASIPVWRNGAARERSFRSPDLPIPWQRGY